MKLLFICSEYPPAATGGIGTFTRGLAEALATEGHEVHVIGNYEGKEARREITSGVHVTRLPAARGRRALLLNRMSLYREIARVAAAGAIDVIEAPDFEGPTAWLPRQSRARVVRLHGSHVYFSNERGLQASTSISWLESKALAQADAIVSVSDYTARRTQELFGFSREIVTIHNSVDVPAKFPRKKVYAANKRAVYFGTLAEKKGVLALADAWRSFHLSHPDWRLSFIGRDATFQGRSVQAQIQERLGESIESVEFVGGLPQEEIFSRLPEYDFAVLPSFSEAFGLVALEAMALGVPVIFTELSSGPEVVRKGIDGWLCDPNRVDSVIAALTKAAGDEAERARVAQAALDAVEARFSYASFVKRNLDFYGGVLARSGGAR